MIMTSSAAPLKRLAEQIEQHLRQRELQLQHHALDQPRPRLTVPLVLFIAGPVVGALGLFYAALAWHGDPLVTYRGWVVVSCTTFCALAVFVAESRWRHAQQHRAPVTRQEVEELLTEAEVERARVFTEALLDQARRTMRLIDAVEPIAEMVRHNNMRIEATAEAVDDMRGDIASAVKQAMAVAYVDTMAGTRSVVRFPNRMRDDIEDRDGR